MDTSPLRRGPSLSTLGRPEFSLCSMIPSAAPGEGSRPDSLLPEERLYPTPPPNQETAKCTFSSAPVGFKVIINRKLGVFYPLGEKDSLTAGSGAEGGGFHKELRKLM